MEQFSDDDQKVVAIVEYEEPDRRRIEAFLRDLGANETLIDTASRHIRNVDVREVVTRFEAYAQNNPAIVLGAISALVAGGAVAAGRAVKKPARRSRPASSKSSTKSSSGRSTKSRSTSARKPAKKASRSTASKRTLIEPHSGDKRYIRRDAKGRIKESVDVGRSLSADSRRHSKTVAKPGRGDKGDR